MTEYEYEYYSAFQKGPNTNTNIIQFSKNDRIRILFGFPKIHSGEKSNKCKQCEYAVLHAYHSSEHLNTHRKEHFHKCEQCDLAFLIQEILGRICKRTDKCNHCKYAQYQTGNLRTQMKMHSGEKLNQCNQCDYVYSDPSTLRTHLKRREKSNKCNQCDFASSRAGDLRRHLKTHIGEKSNKCNQCDFASTQAGDLRRHLKTHSGEKSSKCNLLRQGPRLTWVGEPD